MPIRIKPISFFTFTIQIPGFGSNLFAEKPISNKGTLIPILITNNERAPSKISLAWPIYKIAAARGGATHGLKMSDDNKPKKKICIRLFLLILFSHLDRKVFSDVLK